MTSSRFANPNNCHTQTYTKTLTPITPDSWLPNNLQTLSKPPWLSYSLVRPSFDGICPPRKTALICVVTLLLNLLHSTLLYFDCTGLYLAVLWLYWLYLTVLWLYWLYLTVQCMELGDGAGFSEAQLARAKKCSCRKIQQNRGHCTRGF